MISPLAAGIVAGYGVALPIGAIATYLVALGARAPWRVSAAAALGVATTDGLFAVVAVVGGVGLARLIEPVARPLTLLAAAVLLVIALRTVLTAVRRYRARSAAAVAAEPATMRPWRAYLGLVGLTALNPTTLIYFAALVFGGQATAGAQSVGAGALFAVGAFAASASWQLFLTGSGAALGRVVTGPRGQLGLAAASGVIMIVLAGQLLISSR